jgi:hypothetical protein
MIIFALKMRYFLFRVEYFCYLPHAPVALTLQSAGPEEENPSPVCLSVSISAVKGSKASSKKSTGESSPSLGIPL